MKGGTRRLDQSQLVSWLRLIRTPNVGPATFRDLISRFGSAEDAIGMLPELMRSAGAGRQPNIPTVAQAEAELETAQRCGARFVAVGEPDYPAYLRSMEQPPPLLAVRGSAEVFAMPPTAIVGSRNCSASGARLAQILAAGLGRAGFAVVSGLARGIDAAAHRGSLATGTIAVVAGGLDRPYPPENIPLMESIAEGTGAVVSEMPFGWEPRAKDFPRRNRIIAGLSLGLVVVEATERSGSLISARLAGEMGRLVFAVPGSPLDPRATGTNRLIRNGATLVTDAQDMIEEIQPLTGDMFRRPTMLREAPDLSNALPPEQVDRQRVIDALGPAPVSTDDLIRHTDMPPAQLFTILLELDLAGRIERHSGGSVSLLD